MFYGKNMKFKGLNGNALKIIAAITMAATIIITEEMTMADRMLPPER